MKENAEQTAKTAGGRDWDKLSYSEKNRELYCRQKALLDLFLEKKAITKAQYDKSLRDLTAKMKF